MVYSRGALCRVFEVLLDHGRTSGTRLKPNLRKLPSPPPTSLRPTRGQSAELPVGRRVVFVPVFAHWLHPQLRLCAWGPAGQQRRPAVIIAHRNAIEAASDFVVPYSCVRGINGWKRTRLLCVLSCFDCWRCVHSLGSWITGVRSAVFRYARGKSSARCTMSPT